MFDLQILFDGKWFTLGTYSSRDDAWWALSRWRQDAGCLTIKAFRVQEVPGSSWTPEDVLRQEG
mgnify:CR=1 FL=1